MKIILNYLRMIKIEHTLFALPFALSGMVLAAGGIPSFRIFFWIVFCMVFARSGAMGFNRWADATIDAKNPRTADREIPKGNISKNAALLFVVLSFAMYIFGTKMLNPLAFKLSPVPIAIFIFYSYTKRFTSFCHIILGFALGLAPLGAWVAVKAQFSPLILFLSIGVISWTAGFDLLYSLQDKDFDISEGLYSVPARLGVVFTLITARNLHALAFIMFILNGVAFHLKLFYYSGVVVSGLILMYEHYLVLRYGLEKLNTAFFNMNAAVSVILFAATCIDIFVYG